MTRMPAAVPSAVLATCFAAAVLLHAFSAAAASYFVAEAGSDSNDCGLAQDPSTAKSTIASAISCVQPGDTVYVRGPGVYAGYNFVDVHGRPDAWITVKSYPGERATIDFRRLGGGFGFTRSSYVEVADMEITEPGYFMPSNSCDVFDAACQRAYRPCDTMDTACQLQYAILGGKNNLWTRQGVGFTGSNHIIIRNMEIHDFFGMGIMGGDVPNEGPGTGIQILNNHIHHLGRRGFFNSNYCTYITGPDYVIRGNSCHDSDGSDGMRIGTAYGGPDEELRDSLIENNVSYANGGELNYVYWDGATNSMVVEGVGFAGTGFTFNGYAHNNTIRNNIAYRNGGGGFAWCSPTPGELHIYNNTAYGNGGAGMGSGCGDHSTVTNSISSGNDVLGWGWDLSYWNGARPVLINSLFRYVFTDDTSLATLIDNVTALVPRFSQ